MPKKLSDKEKEYILKRLKAEALDCMSSYGIKKTSVDELVKRVNIPKGTFYLFYTSKELLFFDAINDLHNEIQNRLLQEIKGLSKEITSDRLTDFFMNICQEVSSTGLLDVMLNGDIEYLMRKLPEEVVNEHLAQDDFNIEQLISLLPIKGDRNIEAFSAAFRGVFLTMLHKREIGERNFDEALKLIIKGLVIQILEGE